MTTITTVGILGAGKLGVTLAQLALARGYKVYIAGSGSPDKIALSTKIITPGAMAVTAEAAIERSDVVILALPLGKLSRLDHSLFTDKLVIDAMNYWPEVDGTLDGDATEQTTSTERVQKYLADSTVVKGLNHMAYHDLRDEARQENSAGRKAIAVAGDDKNAVEIVMHFVDTLGFDPLYIGPLKNSRILETGQPGFGANLTRTELESLLLGT